MVVNRRADKDDVLFEQPRINVVSALAAAGLFHDHRYKGGRLIGWIVVKIFHLSKRCAVQDPDPCAFDSSAVTVRIWEFWASQSRVLSLRSFAFILSSVPCFVKRASIAATD